MQLCECVICSDFLQSWKKSENQTRTIPAMLQGMLLQGKKIICFDAGDLILGVFLKCYCNSKMRLLSRPMNFRKCVSSCHNYKVLVISWCFKTGSKLLMRFIDLGRGVGASCRHESFIFTYYSFPDILKLFLALV